MPSNSSESQQGRASYLLLISLLLPMGTVVLVVYFFSRLSPSLELRGFAEALPLRLVAVGGGLSAIMAALAMVILLVVNRQRRRLEKANKRMTEMVGNLIDERVKMSRSIEALNGANQVTLAIKQETSFERIATVVLEQIEFFSKATDIVVFAATREQELDGRARRLNGINTFGQDVDRDNLECELPYEAFVKGTPCRVLESRTGNYSIAIPYHTQDGIRGVVLVRRNVLDDPDFESDLPSFESALIQLVRLVSVGLKFASLWDRAIKDEMTGLFNKNHFNVELPRLMSAATKGGRPFSLIMLDIDKFKWINDTWGHLAGDLVLRQVAAKLVENLRDTDLAFRFGGEELCVVCNDTVADSAARFAERIRQALAHTEFRSEAGHLIPVTASLGVVEFDASKMASEHDLKEGCDRALYAAKHGGRNLVVVARGGEQFEQIERGGNVESEVKRRLGLAGDDTPLPDVEPLADRRGGGKVGKAAQDGIAADAVQPDVKPSPGASMRRLAEQIIEVAEDDSRRLVELAQIVGMTAAAITESRRLGEQAPEVSVPEVASAGAPSDAVAGESVADAATDARPATRRRTRGERRKPSAETPAKERRARPRRAASRPGDESPTEGQHLDSLPSLESELRGLLERVSAVRERVESMEKPAVAAPSADAKTTPLVAEDSLPTNQSARKPKAPRASKPRAPRAPRKRKESSAEPLLDATATDAEATASAAPSVSPPSAEAWTPKPHW